MSAFPSQPRIPQSEPLVAPNVNEGLATPAAAPQQYDPLRDTESLRAAALDHRGSRQIAPFGSYEAVGAALKDGYYTGLEALDFGTLPDGTPAALFTDQNGQRQAIRMSMEQWSAALQQRAQGRMQMAQRMRIAEDAKRLGPAIQQMAKTVESVVPGYTDFAATIAEQDPVAAFTAVQKASRAIEGQQKDEIAAMQAEVDNFRMELNSTTAQKWVETNSSWYQDMASGFLNDETIPLPQRMQRAGEVYRWQKNLEYFIGYIPPSGQMGSTMSFPTYFASVSPDIGAIEDLVDVAMGLLGPSNIGSYPMQQQTMWVVQKAQDAARNIGWVVPFNKMDIDNIATIYQRKVAMQNGNLLGPQVPGPQQPFAQAEQRGQIGRYQAAQQQAQYEQSLREAELAQQQATARKTGAEAERTTEQAGAERQQSARTLAQIEQTMAETALMRGEQPVRGAATQRYGVNAFRQAVQYGDFPFDDTGNLVQDIQRTTAKLARDRTAAGKQRMAEWVKTLRILQPQPTQAPAQ